jgi:2-polyprenyl-3-methyl-5-hydroxy-6-metoxy-1,4-benzoquinol methylase
MNTAGRAALRAYRNRPAQTRLHTRIRWHSAPFSAVEAAVPRTGRILEIGCGHGLFCTYLALTGLDRTVVGVDIDADKIEAARTVGARFAGDRLRFELTESGSVAPGPWDAVVIIDMLYLLPEQQQRELLLAAAAELAPGGVLLIKEMGTAPGWKVRWNSMQETVSVRILGITDRADTGGSEPRFTFVKPASMAGWLRQAGLTTTSERLDRHYPHPHHLLVGRSTSGEPPCDRQGQPAQ